MFINESNETNTFMTKETRKGIKVYFQRKLSQMSCYYSTFYNNKMANKVFDKETPTVSIVRLKETIKLKSETPIYSHCDLE